MLKDHFSPRNLSLLPKLEPYIGYIYSNPAATLSFRVLRAVASSRSALLSVHPRAPAVLCSEVSLDGLSTQGPIHATFHTSPVTYAHAAVTGQTKYRL